MSMLNKLKCYIKGHDFIVYEISKGIYAGICKRCGHFEIIDINN